MLQEQRGGEMTRPPGLRARLCAPLLSHPDTKRLAATGSLIASGGPRLPGLLRLRQGQGKGHRMSQAGAAHRLCIPLALASLCLGFSLNPVTLKGFPGLAIGIVRSREALVLHPQGQDRPP